MAYLPPTEFVKKAIDAGEAKVFMAVKDTIIRAFMAGASGPWRLPSPLLSSKPPDSR